MHCKKMGVLLHTSRCVTGIVSYYTPPHSMRFFILIEITVVTRDVVSYNTVGTGV